MRHWLWIGMVWATAAVAAPTGDIWSLADLGEVAVANALVDADKAEPDKLLFAAQRDDAGQVVRGDRDALVFQFELTRTGAAEYLMLALGDGQRSTLAFLPGEVEEDWRRHPDIEAVVAHAPRVLVAVMSPQQNPPNPVLTKTITDIWRVPGDPPEAYARAVFTGVVLGTRLELAEGGFTRPGEGNWTLVALEKPGGSYLALNSATGQGMFLPKPGDPSSPQVGAALRQAIR